ncbi:MAG: sensor histidine kinase [Sulfobacillus acidophilus]|uniref:histidine kinase n=1 Tax=Sulfobacillus acidophilus TaxID=53633 RepID=A0A2T2WEC2_9FIRM|nr:MAG: sensor histidine kinase [Sulfobacillus acidophilus]
MSESVAPEKPARRTRWFSDWIERLSGQLVLSHVFVAVVVLAFALVVAQFTFRHYLVQSQLNRLSSEAETIDRTVSAPFFEGVISQNTAVAFIHVLQGALSDRVYVYDPYGRILLETGHGNVPAVPPPLSALTKVLQTGQRYKGVGSGDVAIVAVPVSLSPNNIAGVVVLESPLSLSHRTANSLTRLLLLGELGAVVLVGVLAYAISRRLARPLDELRQVVAGTGQDGDLNRRAPEDAGPFEVQALAREFNRMEERIETQMDQLKREAEARDGLMAHVAHDLRTPLTSIRGFLEAVRDGVAVDESHDRAVEVAWEETLRLQRLVDRLLKATRIRSEGGPMAPLSTQAWVQKTLERVAPVLEQHHLRLQWTIREEGTVWGNEDYLVEALVNILDNAIKWSPADSEIEVGTERRGSLMVIRVRDHGPGIAEELLPRVFERFVTGDASRQQSSGLGLSIVDEVARQHGGEVVIHSQLGVGTVVELSLPLYHSDSSGLANED